MVNLRGTMIKNKFVCASLSAFFLTACGSAPTLTEPSGNYVAVNTGVRITPTKRIEASKPKIVANKTPESIALTNKPKSTEFELIKNNNNNGVLKSPVVTNVKPVAHQPNSLLSNNVKNGELLSGNKNPLSTAKPIVKPILPLVIKPVPLRQWNANVGLTLHSTLLKWSGEVPCNIIGKWTINWNSSKDYSIDSALTFRGEYLDAVTQLFNLYKKANSPLFIDVYKTQCLIIVSDASENKK